MRKVLILLVILAVAGLCFTAAAQEVEKTVNLFRSMDDPDITPDPAICDPDHGGVVPNVSLGANLWVSNTRARDGRRPVYCGGGRMRGHEQCAAGGGAGLRWVLHGRDSGAFLSTKKEWIAEF